MDYGYIITVRQTDKPWDYGFRILKNGIYLSREEAERVAYNYFWDFMQKFPRYYVTSEDFLHATDGTMIFEVDILGLNIK